MQKVIFIALLITQASHEVVTTDADVIKCCPQSGMVVLENYDLGFHECLDPQTNITTNLTLHCNSYVYQNMTYVIFKVDEKGRLDLNSIEKLYDSDPVEADSFCFNQEPDFLVAVVCKSDENLKTEMYDSNLTSYAMLVSIPFLLLTALIYSFLPELRDVQGKSIVAMCVAFAASLTLFAVMNLLEYSDMTLCAIKGFTAYYATTASFLWMNAISIQVFRSVRFSSSLDRSKNEFMWYSLYAWGGAGALTLCVVAANYIPGEHVVPGIGLNTCWFFRAYEQWLFSYSIMCILIIVNITLFIYTSLVLWRQSFSSNNIKVLRLKFTMSLRLMVLMGISWVFELASSAHGKYNKFWVVMDIYNCLQGVLIFLVLVVLRKRALKGLHRRGCCCCLSNIVKKYLSGDEEDVEPVDHTLVIPLNGRP